MRPLHMFYVGWGCIVLSILVAAGPLLALAFVGIGLIISAVGKWAGQNG